MTPSEFRFELLDAASPPDREAYERSFYEAFQRAPANRLVHHLWLWDYERQRVATRVPYEDQLIYLLREADGRVAMAMAANVRLRTFQSAAYGFTPPGVAGCCEFLVLFTLGEYRLETGLAFWTAFMDDLRSRGFHTAYATTATWLVGFYRRFLAKVLQESEVRGEKRHFLAFDIREPTRWRPRATI